MPHLHLPAPHCSSVTQLVLINVSDHYTRTKANSGGAAAQVFGVLLGSQAGRTVDIINSFEIKHQLNPQGGVVVDLPFLTHKQEQCAPNLSDGTIAARTQRRCCAWLNAA